MPVIAATSRAIPIMLKQSARLGVILTSKIVSLKSRAVSNGTPKVKFSGSCQIPAELSPVESSASEHSIPSDFSPRKTEDLIVCPPGIVAPTLANGTIFPAFIFWAPQTTLYVWEPSVTSHKDSLSAAG